MAQLKSTVVQGNLTASGQILADKIIKNGGSENDILLANGTTINKNTFTTTSQHDALSGNLALVSGKVDGMEDHGDRITSAEGAITALQDTVGTHTNRITTAEGKISTLETASDTYVKLDGTRTMTGNLKATGIELFNHPSSGTASKKATYKYNDTDDCVELIFH